MSTSEASLQQELGFADRDQDYNKPMTWVVVTGGRTVTLQMNGPQHFGRKHLLLPSRKGKDMTDAEAYVASKEANRFAHRKNLNWSASAGSENKRWATKYKGTGPANTVLNLVPESQKGIQSKEAAVRFAQAILARTWANGEEAAVEVDFGKPCVHITGASGTSAQSKMKVLFKRTGVDTYLAVHYMAH